MKVLVVEDDIYTLDVLDMVIQSAGYDIRTAKNGDKGIELFRSFRPEVVITDIEMPGKSGLEMLGEIREENERAIVVMATATTNAEYVMRALKLRANDYLQKPFDPKEILTVLSKYQSIIQERRLEKEILGMVDYRMVVTRFDNRVTLVPKYVNQLMAETGEAIDPSRALGAHLGLTELLTNAIEHGNLEISYQEKSKAREDLDGGLEALFERRQANPELSRRRVTVEFVLDDEWLTWTITDEGFGFDWKAIPDPTKEENAMLTHGRGIFLSRFQFDELEYQGVGNCVRASIRRNPGKKTQA